MIFIFRLFQGQSQQTRQTADEFIGSSIRHAVWTPVFEVADGVGGACGNETACCDV
jgi:hypothetical protein